MTCQSTGQQMDCFNHILIQSEWNCSARERKDILVSIFILVFSDDRQTSQYTVTLCWRGRMLTCWSTRKLWKQRRHCIPCSRSWDPGRTCVSGKIFKTCFGTTSDTSVSAVTQNGQFPLNIFKQLDYIYIYTYICSDYMIDLLHISWLSAKLFLLSTISCHDWFLFCIIIFNPHRCQLENMKGKNNKTKPLFGG